METVKILYKDIQCIYCKKLVNRRIADKDGWIDIVEVDFSGMSRGRVGYCCNTAACKTKLNKDIQEDARAREKE